MDALYILANQGKKTPMVKKRHLNSFGTLKNRRDMTILRNKLKGILM